MRVIEIAEPGGPEVLRLATRPRVEALPGDRVRVRVSAAGVNRADLLQRRGRYPAPVGFPSDVPGLEYAGEVVELGSTCTLRSVGDRVMGILGGGGYAEEVIVPERETIRVPRELSLVEAGAIPEAFVTAWDALSNQAGLLAGETVLIHAVGSGVGTAALQLALVAGARVVGTSRTREKLERADDLGLALAVVTGDGRDWASDARSRLEGGSADVILDLVGAGYLDGNLDLLAERGRWIVVGVTGGSRGELDLRGLMGKRASIRGTVLRARPPEEKALLAREFERTVVPLFERGALRPVVDRVLPAGDAPEAHRLLEGNRTFGKLLLAW